MDSPKAERLVLKSIPVDADVDLPSNSNLQARGDGQFTDKINSTADGTTSSKIEHPESSNLSEYRTIAEARARDSLSSYPGNDSFGGNGDHQGIRDLLKGKIVSGSDLDELGHVLFYRMQCMELATKYKDYLNLEFPNCTSYDSYASTLQTVLAANNSGNSGESARLKRARYCGIRAMVWKKKIFGAAVSRQGLTCLKPRDYLAIALAESQMSVVEVEVALDKLVQCRFSCLRLFCEKKI